MHPIRLSVLTLLLLAACPSPQGTEGPQGPAGPQGVPGAVGPQGPVGPVGPVGPQGPQGPEGKVVVVDGGVVTGPQGPIGPRGASVVVVAIGPDAGCPSKGVRVSLEDGGAPQIICDGQSVVGASEPPGTNCAFGGVKYASASGFGYVCNGATGAQGLAGATGATGPQGPMGAAGAQGATGPQGPQGSQGPQGPQGPPGAAVLLDGGSLPVLASDGYTFAGFTTASYDGNLGGPAGANAKCAAEFSGSHLCTTREYQWAGSAVAPGANGAWLDYAYFSSQGSPNQLPRDRDGSYSCNAWRSNNGPSEYARYLDQQGYYVPPAYNFCNVSRQLACCRSPHGGWFRGFTAQLYDGNLGGPVGANAKCASEFPGAHLCTTREYQWAGSGAAPGASGAWIDYAYFSSQGSPNQFPRDRDGSYSCNAWRSNNGPAEYARYLDPQGYYVPPAYNFCNVPRQLACCG